MDDEGPVGGEAGRGRHRTPDMLTGSPMPHCEALAEHAPLSALYLLPEPEHVRAGGT